MAGRLLALFLLPVLAAIVDNSSQHQHQQLLQQHQTEADDNDSEPAMKEYCNFETFTATCPEGSVVFMVKALYGRMRMGKCLKSDTYVGCHSDVLREMDARCSGQPSCAMTIPDATLHQTLNCLDDMMAYLQASYKCLHVTQANVVSDCDDKNPSRISAPSIGYSFLSSYWMRSQGWINCPVSITAPPGQRIELSIMEFSPQYRTEVDRDAAEESKLLNVEDRRSYHDVNKMLDYCHVYAVVTEQKRSKELTVCQGSAREAHVYSSLNNTILLQLSDQIANDRSITFLIKYGVSGCPDLAPPKNAWIKRDKNQAIITCNSTALTWHLVCKGTSWIGKEAANECEEKSSHEEGLFQGPSFPTYGLLTAVVTGVFIGAVCGFSLLGAVLWCKRRTSRTSSRSHKECGLQMIQENMRISGPPTETTEYDVSTYDPHYHHHHHHHGFYPGQSRFAQQTPEHFHSGGSFQPPCKVHHRLENGEYGYTHVWEIAGNDGESKHPHLAIMGSEDTSPDNMALNFSAYSPSSYNGSRLTSNSPMAQNTSQTNLMLKQTVSSFKPQRQEPKEVCSYPSCSKQHPANYTFVKLSEAPQAIEETCLSLPSKPLLDHPSLLQDHVQKVTLNSDLRASQTAANEDWCSGNSKDFCRSTECCSAEQSKALAASKKLENHYT